MEKDSFKYMKIDDKNQNGIKILADQMAKRMLEFDLDQNNRNSISQEQIIKLLLSLREKETEAENLKQNDNEDINKINQNQEINSNINTNVNTKENNQNTIINTIANTGSNINTNTNNENEFGSNLNTRRSKVSLIDELINEYIINPTEINNDKKIEKESQDSIDYTFDEDSFYNNNINTTNPSTKIKKTKNKKSTIYDRCIHDRKAKQVKLDKKRKEYEIKTLKLLTPHPKINPLTDKYLENKEYIPIEERAAQIQNMKLMKLCMNEHVMSHKELEDLREIKKHEYKKFDRYDWNRFINRQKKWNKNLQYKKKAMILLKHNEEDEKFFKPKINSRSKSIIDEENKNYIDEVYDRLYNDYDEHLERQKYRNQQSLPSFKPKITKCNSQKNIGFDLNKINRYESNPLMHLNRKNYTKKTYNLNNSMDRKNELFIDSCKNFQNQLKRNKNFNNKFMKFVNKSQQTNQQTNNNFSNINCSRVSSGLINSKYIILDNQKKNEKSSKNSSAPFLPLNIKKMIENNCKEDEELENINKISKQNFEKEKYRLNYSLYNMEESKEKLKNDKYTESEIDSLNAGTERIGNNLINRNENSLNVNYSELISQKEKDQGRILEELEKAKKIIQKNKGESLDSESNKNENNTYKINIRDSTPHLVKEDKILASKNYSDFFDIPDLEKDI